MISLHVLGTASARPANGRSVSGSILSMAHGGVLVDCGEGFQERFTAHNRRLGAADGMTKVRRSRLEAVMLTHGHLDHTWGVLPFLQTMGLDGRTRPLTIIGPTRQDVLRTLGTPGTSLPEDLPAVDLARQFQIWRDLGANEHHLGVPIRWVLIAADGSQAMEWMASGEHRQLESIPQPLKGAHIRPLETRHSVPSCAWSVSTEAKAGRFDRDRVDRLGLDATQRRTLANGAPIELEDGTHLRPEDLRGPERPGRCIVVSGDTGANPPGYQSVDHPVDLLVHEATFLEEHRQAADRWLHCTASDAAEAATMIGATALALTHFSSRLTSTTTSLEEARDRFPNTLAIEDGDVLTLGPEGSLLHHRWHHDGFRCMPTIR